MATGKMSAFLSLSCLAVRACPGKCSFMLDGGKASSPGGWLAGDSVPSFGVMHHFFSRYVCRRGQGRSASVRDVVQLTLDGNDELRDDGQDLVGPGAEHVVHALLREKGVRHLQLAETVEEDWEVVVEIQLQRRRVFFRSHKDNNKGGEKCAGSLE